MPDTIETDPKKGFVALPMSVFELDLSPGAFRTLAELCRMANAEGQCWPSLGQLGDRLNRSRAALSGYISELRDAGLIETETQKMANGYNYRLRYRVVFWKAWRKQLGQPAERRVQQAERPLRTQNQNHINQSPAPAVDQDLISAWKQSVGRAPYPAFDIWPSEALITKSQQVISEDSDIISADIFAAFEQFLGRKGISPLLVTPDIKRFLTHGAGQSRSIPAFCDALEGVWKPHWVKPPSLQQLERLMRPLPCRNDARAGKKLIGSYLKRWETHSRSLSLGGSAAKVAA